MKVLFKNVTEYTKENCTYLEDFHQKKYGKKEIASLGLIVLLVLYIFFLNMIHGNLLVVIGILCFVVLFYWFQKRKLGKISKEKSKTKVFTFYFYENYIKVRCKRQWDRVLYFSLHKVFETDKFFYLYTDERSSFILEKKGFKIGNAKEFSSFIKAKCPFKYHKETKH